MRGFAADAGGATAIEYTLCAMLVGVVIIGTLTAIGTSLNTMIATVLPGLQ